MSNPTINPISCVALPKELEFDGKFRGKVQYYPWVPKNYKDGLTAGVRLLLLGNSHYCKKKEDFDNHFFTRENMPLICPHCFESNPDEKELLIYRRLNRLLRDVLPAFGPIERASFTEYWPFAYVGYYNLLNIGLKQARGTRHNNLYRNSLKAFFTVLSAIKPTHLLVLGVETWNQLWNRKTFTESDWPFPELLKCYLEWTDTKSSSLLKFKYEGGSCLAAHVKHPSWASWENNERKQCNGLTALENNKRVLKELLLER